MSRIDGVAEESSSPKAPTVVQNWFCCGELTWAMRTAEVSGARPAAISFRLRWRSPFPGMYTTMVASACANEFQSGSSTGLVAADKNDARAFIAIGERNAQRSGGGIRGSNARHDFKCDFCGTQPFEFFVEAAKDSRIAALQAHHLLAFARCVHHERINFALGNFFHTAALADVDYDGAPAGQREDRGADQIVVQHEVRLPKQAMSFEGEEFRIARTSADQKHLSGELRRWCVHRVCTVWIAIDRLCCSAGLNAAPSGA